MALLMQEKDLNVWIQIQGKARERGREKEEEAMSEGKSRREEGEKNQLSDSSCPDRFLGRSALEAGLWAPISSGPISLSTLSIETELFLGPCPHLRLIQWLLVALGCKCLERRERWKVLIELLLEPLRWAPSSVRCPRPLPGSAHSRAGAGLGGLLPSTSFSSSRETRQIGTSSRLK